MASDLHLKIDEGIGRAVERAMRAHHRRRLARIGWDHALDGAPPDDEPIPGNAFEVLIDGATALPAIAEAIRSAESHVHLAGWTFSPGLALERDGEPTVLRNLLAETAERVDVRVLTWAGAPLPLFHPSRREVRRMRDQLCKHTAIRCALDSRERPMHCHHEKIVVVDDRIAFVGGIDLTSFQGDRFDTSRHLARAAAGWHDASSRIQGPAAAAVARHFALRWREVTRETLPEPEPAGTAGDIAVRLVRTVPEKIYDALPRGDFGILAAYVCALRGARSLVYLENQFLWSPEIVEILAAKLRDPPQDDFRLVVVLPADPNNGDDDTRGMLAELVDADNGAGRFLPCTLYARVGRRADPVYVHAKIGLVDDRWLTLGSANLNEHSLFNDTEMNVVVEDEDVVRDVRARLWSEHLEQPVAPTDDIVGLVDERWRPIAEEQHGRRKRSEPLSHRLVRLPHVSRRSARLKGPLNSLLVDG
jgi:phosphatidylserine/phosphatidylglycerophosphate/cardiolipin synthase-like enzyme